MEEKLEQAKSALHLCLRSLAEGDSFNLVAFNHAFMQEIKNMAHAYK